MKIEIEYSEIEKLKSKIAELTSDNKKLSDKLNSLDEEELKKQAVKLSYSMLHSINSRVFKELGFEEHALGDIIFEDNLSHYLGADWFAHRKLKVNLGATITTRYKHAFLKLGILTDEESASKKEG